VLEDLRELSRGLHPPLLARRGLRSALRALARESPIPVEIEIDLPERPSAALETAAYYVVSESMTNAIKHSQASAISIKIETDHAGEPFAVGLDGRSRGVTLHATIADDGIGGADPSAGSGLTGLADRVDALGGRFDLDTPGGGGTRIMVELPLERR
jgi:signal transduction histidine kinase